MRRYFQNSTDFQNLSTYPPLKSMQRWIFTERSWYFWNFDAQILKIWKIHRKLRIKQTSVLFCRYLRNESFDLYEIWDFYSWDSKKLSNDFSKRSVHRQAHKRRKRARARFVATKCARACLRLVCAHVCTDLYEKFVDDFLLSYE